MSSTFVNSEAPDLELLCFLATGVCGSMDKGLHGICHLQMVVTKRIKKKVKED